MNSNGISGTSRTLAIGDMAEKRNWYVSLVIRKPHPSNVFRAQLRSRARSYRNSELRSTPVGCSALQWIRTLFLERIWNERAGSPSDNIVTFHSVEDVKGLAPSPTTPSTEHGKSSSIQVWPTTLKGHGSLTSDGTNPMSEKGAAGAPRPWTKRGASHNFIARHVCKPMHGPTWTH